MTNIKKVFGVPHFHSDLQWWKTEERYAEDIEKILDKALDFLEKDENFKYTIDQVTAFKPYVESSQERMSRIRKHVENDRIELVGGTWTAPDENIPTGEAIIRQFLYGKNYLRENFDTEPKVAWEIDEFGHPYQLPQLLKKSGFDYFGFSRGVSPWNAGHDLDFYWEAPDGSEVLTHWFAGSYTGMTGLLPLTSLSPEGRMVGELENRIEYEGERAPTDNLMVPFGTDFAVPMNDWLDFPETWNSQKDEKVSLSTPREFFEEVEKNDLSTVGPKEFNPLFTGCYESREKIKRGCRKTQDMIIKAEKLACFAYSLGMEYPENKLDSAWKYILKNDSHDTICGTETDKPYRELSMKRYELAEELINEVIEKALDFLTDKIDTTGRGDPVIVFNTLNWSREEVVSLKINPDQDVEIRDDEGNIVLSQMEEDRLYFKAKVPPLGYRVFFIFPHEENKQKTDLKTDSNTLENKHYKIKINEDTGCIQSIHDKKTDKEILETEEFQGNELVANEDVGNLWTVHELEQKFRSTKHKSQTNTIRNGPLLKTIQTHGESNDFEWEQKITLYAGIRRIDFETQINFKGKSKRVKTVFQPKLKGKNYYETPFYTAERKDGHWPAQNWVDISSDDYGFALINTGNPGYEVQDGVLSMTLFRSVSVLSSRFPEFILKNFTDLLGKLKKALKLSLKGLYIGEWVLYPYHGLTLREYASEGGPEPEDGWTLIDHLLPYLTFWKEAEAWERGHHSFKYTVYPHEGDWKDADLPKRGYEVNETMTVKNAQSGEGELPKKFSFSELKGEGVVLSALKKQINGEGLVARIYETNGKDSEIELSFFKEIKSAKVTSLTEDDTYQKLGVSNNSLKSSIKENEIKTLSVELKEIG